MKLLSLPRRRTLLGTLLGALLGLPAGRAHADGWLVAETPVAIAVSSAQEGAFRPGLMPALGAYLDGWRLSLGVRLRAGVLRNGPAPAGNLTDPGLGGLATGSLAARLPISRGWLEVAAGGGLTGRELVPAFEAGAGWTFPAWGFDVGPSVRLVHVVSRDEMDSFGSADLVLAGVDVRIGAARPRPRPAPVATAVAAVTAPPTAPPPLPAETDGDAPADRDASCAEAPEGCPPSSPPPAEEIVVENDRIILDNDVLFDLDQARIRTRGRKVIAQIARLWALHPEWRRMTIEGHACDLGTPEYNQALSRSRAEHVRDALIQAGVPADHLEAVGFGSTRPRDPAHTDAARARNRRVEFQIERGGQP